MNKVGTELTRGDDGLGAKHRPDKVTPVWRYLEPGPLAAGFSSDKPRTDQYREVMAHRRLASIEGFSQITGADLSLRNAGDHAQEAQTDRIGQRLENIGHVFSLGHRERFIDYRFAAGFVGGHRRQPNTLTIIDMRSRVNRIDTCRYERSPVMSARIELREKVRERYAASAVDNSGCCGKGNCGPDATIATDLTAGAYTESELSALPSKAVEASLGCGNPTAVAELSKGDRVLDLGSGGGIDVLLSAQRVGPTGFVYGLDMTDEMLDLARNNAADAGAPNVEFLKGFIEEIPLADAGLDVVISNCVINLSVDKPAVFAEIHRVLRPGGRIGISDIVAQDHLSPSERAERGDWVGCIAGALSYEEYREGLEAAGFEQVTLTPTHTVTEGMDSVIIRAIKAS